MAWGIEYFVGSARGRYAPGLRRFATREEAQAVAREELLNEIRHFAGIYSRRVVRL